MTNPLLFQDASIDSDELSNIITRIEDATDDIPDSRLIVALITLAIYKQSDNLTLEELADEAFEVSKYIVARLCGRSAKDMN